MKAPARRQRDVLRRAAVLAAAVAAFLFIPLASHSRDANAQTQQSGNLSQFAWFDRTGKRVGTFGDLADYGDMDLSPDGKRLAVSVLDPAVGSRDIWLFDLSGAGRLRLTSDRGDEAWSTWSPDGRRVAFNSTRLGTYDLFEMASDGKGMDSEVLAGGDPKWPVSWSSDGRHLLYVTSNQKENQRWRVPTRAHPEGEPLPENDVWVLPRFGDRKPYALLQTTATEFFAAFSPDGKWIAYSATDPEVAPGLSQPEVYVIQFPPTGRKWQISSGGGTGARWRHDGSEIFYVTPQRTLMAAQVNASGSNLEVKSRQVLFETRVASSPYRAFVVSPDGQRILINTLVAGGGPAINAGLFSGRPFQLASLTTQPSN